ncbi:hypothetical protein DSCW_14160 [Desulfosarcina widdelii]|uniref:Solute-binding protein family 3/N-terminal domain-containing protein n=2 Tax=Desulfosarcina widdelii TaxID=947919 RepID=A0A5K7Z188_9BACT|nr:hypothetical protein DSCW_14160 [Desulfosarcina widdelii]
MILTFDAAAETVVFSVGNFEPYHYEENGEVKGVFVETVGSVCERLDLTPRFIVYPWKRAIALVKSGEVDGIISVFHTEERAGFLYYCPEPFCYTRTAILSGKENDRRVRKLTDLKGTYLYQVRGTFYGPCYDKRKDIFKDIWICDNIEKQIQLLDKRPFHYAIANEMSFRAVSAKLGLKDRFRTVFVVNKNPLHVAFSKALGEKGRNYAEKFGVVLRQLREEGQVPKIAK